MTVQPAIASDPVELSRLLMSFTVVSPLTGCYQWNSHKAPYGYGVVTLRGVGTRVIHRLVWESVHGKLPRSTTVMHKCDSTSCWNIEHLRTGTQRENNLDCVAKGRHAQASATHCKRRHEFTPENTKRNNNGHRCCIACSKLYGSSPTKNPHNSPVCKRGHLRSPENTYQEPNGGRKCRICMRDKLTKRRAAMLSSKSLNHRSVYLSTGDSPIEGHPPIDSGETLSNQPG